MSARRVVAMVGMTVGVSVFAFGGTSVSADDDPPPPVAGCGAGYQLLTVDGTLDQIDERPYVANATWDTVVVPGVNSLDVNDDGHLCSKRLGINTGQNKKLGPDRHWTTNISDNHAIGRL